MDIKYQKRAIVLSLLMIILLLSVMGSATYAWFTAANKLVATNRISARTGDAELRLEVSTSPNFPGNTAETAILQVNRTSLTELMPVSTDDLLSFVYCPSTAGETAAHFVPVENERYYYHGRIYIRAAAVGLPEDSVISLYLDGTTSNPILGNADNLIVNASRLGLRISGGDGNERIIFRLSDAGNGAGSGMNTRVNGVDQPAGIVLHSNGTQAVTPVKDPSVPYSTYTITASGALPEQPLCQMKPNVTYTMDIYYYLEGCDPDCTNIISASMAEIGLQFYATLS